MSITLSYSQLEISSEIRPRTEYSHGYGTLVEPDQDASTYTAQRTRLNFDYKNEYVKSKIVLQDVRLWGGQPQLVANEDYSASLHEAWAEILFNSQFSLKIGRQQVAYDDHRILGSVGWAHQARAHDMAIFKYNGFFKLDIGYAHNENSNRKNNFYDTPSYKSLQFVWLNKKITDLSISLLFLNNGLPLNTIENNQLKEQEIKYNQTLGSRFSYNKSRLNASINAYYQMGDLPNDKEISAYNLGLDISYKISEMFSATIGSEILSGANYDDQPDEQKAFSPFFGTNHKFNGYMDYFYVGNHFNFIGLVDHYLKFKFSHEKLSLQIHGHHFSAHGNYDVSEDKYLGAELDFVANYKLNDIVNFSAGYSQMFASDLIGKFKIGDESETNNWAWLMITVKPTLFSNKE